MLQSNGPETIIALNETINTLVDSQIAAASKPLGKATVPADSDGCIQTARALLAGQFGPRSGAGITQQGGRAALQTTLSHLAWHWLLHICLAKGQWLAVARLLSKPPSQLLDGRQESDTRSPPSINAGLGRQDEGSSEVESLRVVARCTHEQHVRILALLQALRVAGGGSGPAPVGTGLSGPQAVQWSSAGSSFPGHTSVGDQARAAAPQSNSRPALASDLPAVGELDMWLCQLELAQTSPRAGNHTSQPSFSEGGALTPQPCLDAAIHMSTRATGNKGEWMVAVGRLGVLSLVRVTLPTYGLDVHEDTLGSFVPSRSTERMRTAFVDAAGPGLGSTPLVYPPAIASQAHAAKLVAAKLLAQQGSSSSSSVAEAEVVACMRFSAVMLPPVLGPEQDALLATQAGHSVKAGSRSMTENSLALEDRCFSVQPLFLGAGTLAVLTLWSRSDGSAVFRLLRCDPATLSQAKWTPMGTAASGALASTLPSMAALLHGAAACGLPIAVNVRWTQTQEAASADSGFTESTRQVALFIPSSHSTPLRVAALRLSVAEQVPGAARLYVETTSLQTATLQVASDHSTASPYDIAPVASPRSVLCAPENTLAHSSSMHPGTVPPGYAVARRVPCAGILHGIWLRCMHMSSIIVRIWRPARASSNNTHCLVQQFTVPARPLNPMVDLSAFPTAGRRVCEEYIVTVQAEPTPECTHGAGLGLLHSRSLQAQPGVAHSASSQAGCKARSASTVSFDSELSVASSRGSFSSDTDQSVAEAIPDHEADSDGVAPSPTSPAVDLSGELGVACLPLDDVEADFTSFLGLPPPVCQLAVGMVLFTAAAMPSVAVPISCHIAGNTPTASCAGADADHTKLASAHGCSFSVCLGTGHVQVDASTACNPSKGARQMSAQASARVQLGKQTLAVDMFSAVQPKARVNGADVDSLEFPFDVSTGTDARVCIHACIEHARDATTPLTGTLMFSAFVKCIETADAATLIACVSSLLAKSEHEAADSRAILLPGALAVFQRRMLSVVRSHCIQQSVLDSVFMGLVDAYCQATQSEASDADFVKCAVVLLQGNFELGFELLRIAVQPNHQEGVVKQLGGPAGNSLAKMKPQLLQSTAAALFPDEVTMGAFMFKLLDEADLLDADACSLLKRFFRFSHTLLKQARRSEERPEGRGLQPPSTAFCEAVLQLACQHLAQGPQQCKLVMKTWALLVAAYVLKSGASVLQFSERQGNVASLRHSFCANAAFVATACVGHALRAAETVTPPDWSHVLADFGGGAEGGSPSWLPRELAATVPATLTKWFALFEGILRVSSTVTSVPALRESPYGSGRGHLAKPMPALHIPASNAPPGVQLTQLFPLRGKAKDANTSNSWQNIWPLLTVLMPRASVVEAAQGSAHLGASSLGSSAQPILLHLPASAGAVAPTSADARALCEQLMKGIRAGRVALAGQVACVTRFMSARSMLSLWASPHRRELMHAFAVADGLPEESLGAALEGSQGAAVPATFGQYSVQSYGPVQQLAVGASAQGMAFVSLDLSQLPKYHGSESSDVGDCMEVLLFPSAHNLPQHYLERCTQLSSVRTPPSAPSSPAVLQDTSHTQAEYQLSKTEATHGQDDDTVSEGSSSTDSARSEHSAAHSEHSHANTTGHVGPSSLHHGGAASVDGQHDPSILGTHSGSGGVGGNTSAVPDEEPAQLAPAAITKGPHGTMAWTLSPPVQQAPEDLSVLVRLRFSRAAGSQAWTAAGVVASSVPQAAGIQFAGISTQSLKTRMQLQPIVCDSESLTTFALPGCCPTVVFRLPGKASSKTSSLASPCAVSVRIVPRGPAVATDSSQNSNEDTLRGAFDLTAMREASLNCAMRVLKHRKLGQQASAEHERGAFSTAENDTFQDIQSRFRLHLRARFSEHSSARAARKTAPLALEGAAAVGDSGQASSTKAHQVALSSQVSTGSSFPLHSEDALDSQGHVPPGSPPTRPVLAVAESTLSVLNDMSAHSQGAGILQGSTAKQPAAASSLGAPVRSSPHSSQSSRSGDACADPADAVQFTPEAAGAGHAGPTWMAPRAQWMSPIRGVLQESIEPMGMTPFRLDASSAGDSRASPTEGDTPSVHGDDGEAATPLLSAAPSPQLRALRATGGAASASATQPSSVGSSSVLAALSGTITPPALTASPLAAAVVAVPSMNSGAEREGCMLRRGSVGIDMNDVTAVEMSPAISAMHLDAASAATPAALSLGSAQSAKQTTSAASVLASSSSGGMSLLSVLAGSAASTSLTTRTSALGLSQMSGTPHVTTDAPATDSQDDASAWLKRNIRPLAATRHGSSWWAAHSIFSRGFEWTVPEGPERHKGTPGRSPSSSKKHRGLVMPIRAVEELLFAESIVRLRLSESRHEAVLQLHAEALAKWSKTNIAPTSLTSFSGSQFNGAWSSLVPDLAARDTAPLSSPAAWALYLQAAARDSAPRMQQRTLWQPVRPSIPALLASGSSSLDDESSAVHECERAVVAALLKHSCTLPTAIEHFKQFRKWEKQATGVVGADALSTELQPPPPVPPALLALWSRARRVRRWMKDVKAKAPMDPHVYGKLSSGVVERAMLLLDVKTQPEGGGLEHHASPGRSPARPAAFPASPSLQALRVATRMGLKQSPDMLARAAKWQARSSAAPDRPRAAAAPVPGGFQTPIMAPPVPPRMVSPLSANSGGARSVRHIASPSPGRQAAPADLSGDELLSAVLVFCTSHALSTTRLTRAVEKVVNTEEHKRTSQVLLGQLLHIAILLTEQTEQSQSSSGSGTAPFVQALILTEAAVSQGESNVEMSLTVFSTAAQAICEYLRRSILRHSAGVADGSFLLSDIELIPCLFATARKVLQQSCALPSDSDALIHSHAAMADLLALTAALQRLACKEPVQRLQVPLSAHPPSSSGMVLLDVSALCAASASSGVGSARALLLSPHHQMRHAFTSRRFQKYTKSLFTSDFIHSGWSSSASGSSAPWKQPASVSVLRLMDEDLVTWDMLLSQLYSGASNESTQNAALTETRAAVSTPLVGVHEVVPILSPESAQRILTSVRLGPGAQQRRTSAEKMIKHATGATWKGIVHSNAFLPSVPVPAQWELPLPASVQQAFWRDGPQATSAALPAGDAPSLTATLTTRATTEDTSLAKLGAQSGVVHWISPRAIVDIQIPHLACRSLFSVELFGTLTSDAVREVVIYVSSFGNASEYQGYAKRAGKSGVPMKQWSLGKRVRIPRLKAWVPVLARPEFVAMLSTCFLHPLSSDLLSPSGMLPVPIRRIRVGAIVSSASSVAVQLQPVRICMQCSPATSATQGDLGTSHGSTYTPADALRSAACVAQRAAASIGLALQQSSDSKVKVARNVLDAVADTLQFSKQQLEQRSVPVTTWAEASCSSLSSVAHVVGRLFEDLHPARHGELFSYTQSILKLALHTIYGMHQRDSVHAGLLRTLCVFASQFCSLICSGGDTLSSTAVDSILTQVLLMCGRVQSRLGPILSFSVCARGLVVALLEEASCTSAMESHCMQWISTTFQNSMLDTARLELGALLGNLLLGSASESLAPGQKLLLSHASSCAVVVEAAAHITQSPASNDFHSASAVVGVPTSWQAGHTYSLESFMPAAVVGERRGWEAADFQVLAYTTEESKHAQMIGVVVLVSLCDRVIPWRTTVHRSQVSVFCPKPDRSLGQLEAVQHMLTCASKHMSSNHACSAACKALCVRLWLAALGSAQLDHAPAHALKSDPAFVKWLAESSQAETIAHVDASLTCGGFAGLAASELAVLEPDAIDGQPGPDQQDTATAQAQLASTQEIEVDLHQSGRGSKQQLHASISVTSGCAVVNLWLGGTSICSLAGMEVTTAPMHASEVPLITVRHGVSIPSSSVRGNIVLYEVPSEASGSQEDSTSYPAAIAHGTKALTAAGAAAIVISVIQDDLGSGSPTWGSSSLGESLCLLLASPSSPSAQIHESKDPGQESSDSTCAVLLTGAASICAQAATLDVAVWAAALSVGSRVDAQLPLTGAWAKATVITCAPPPFSHWYRVAFDGLGYDYARWVSWEGSAAAVSRGSVRSSEAAQYETVQLARKLEDCKLDSGPVVSEAGSVTPSNADAPGDTQHSTDGTGTFTGNTVATELAASTHTRVILSDMAAQEQRAASAGAQGPGTEQAGQHVDMGAAVAWGPMQMAPLGWVTGDISLVDPRSLDSVYQPTEPDKPLQDLSSRMSLSALAPGAPFIAVQPIVLPHWRHSILQTAKDMCLGQRPSDQLVSTVYATHYDDQHGVGEAMTGTGGTAALASVRWASELAPNCSIPMYPSCCPVRAVAAQSSGGAAAADTESGEQALVFSHVLVARSAAAVKEATLRWRRSLGAGDIVNACDVHRKWFEAVVLGVENGVARVRYLGWSPQSDPGKYDEGVSIRSPRLLPAGTKARDWRRVQVGDELETRDDRTVDHSVVTGVDRHSGSVSIMDAPGIWVGLGNFFELASFATHKRPRLYTNIDSEPLRPPHECHSDTPDRMDISVPYAKFIWHQPSIAQVLQLLAYLSLSCPGAMLALPAPAAEAASSGTGAAQGPVRASMDNLDGSAFCPDVEDGFDFRGSGSSLVNMEQLVWQSPPGIATPPRESTALRSGQSSSPAVSHSLAVAREASPASPPSPAGTGFPGISSPGTWGTLLDSLMQPGGQARLADLLEHALANETAHVVAGPDGEFTLDFQSLDMAWSNVLSDSMHDGAAAAAGEQSLEGTLYEAAVDAEAAGSSEEHVQSVLQAVLHALVSVAGDDVRSLANGWGRVLLGDALRVDPPFNGFDAISGQVVAHPSMSPAARLARHTRQLLAHVWPRLAPVVQFPIREGNAGSRRPKRAVELASLEGNQTEDCILKGGWQSANGGLHPLLMQRLSRAFGSATPSSPEAMFHELMQAVAGSPYGYTQALRLLPASVSVYPSPAADGISWGGGAQGNLHINTYIQLPNATEGLSFSAWLRIPKGGVGPGGVLMHQPALPDSAFLHPLPEGTLAQVKYSGSSWYAGAVASDSDSHSAVTQQSADGSALWDTQALQRAARQGYAVLYEDGDRSVGMSWSRVRPRPAARQSFTVCVLADGRLRVALDVFHTSYSEACCRTPFVSSAHDAAAAARGATADHISPTPAYFRQLETYEPPVASSTAGLMDDDADAAATSLSPQPPRQLKLRTTGSSTDAITSRFPLQEETWVHVAATVGGGQMALYVDGECVSMSETESHLRSSGVWVQGVASSAAVHHSSASAGQAASRHQLMMHSREPNTAQNSGLPQLAADAGVLPNFEPGVRCDLAGCHIFPAVLSQPGVLTAMLATSSGHKLVELGGAQVAINATAPRTVQSWKRNPEASALTAHPSTQSLSGASRPRSTSRNQALQLQRRGPGEGMFQVQQERLARAIAARGAQRDERVADLDVQHGQSSDSSPDSSAGGAVDDALAGFADAWLGQRDRAVFTPMRPRRTQRVQDASVDSEPPHSPQMASTGAAADLAAASPPAAPAAPSVPFVLSAPLPPSEQACILQRTWESLVSILLCRRASASWAAGLMDDSALLSVQPWVAVTSLVSRIQDAPSATASGQYMEREGASLIGLPGAPAFYPDLAGRALPAVDTAPRPGSASEAASSNAALHVLLQPGAPVLLDVYNRQLSGVILTEFDREHKYCARITGMYTNPPPCAQPDTDSPGSPGSPAAASGPSSARTSMQPTKLLSFPGASAVGLQGWPSRANPSLTEAAHRASSASPESAHDDAHIQSALSSVFDREQQEAWSPQWDVAVLRSRANPMALASGLAATADGGAGSPMRPQHGTSAMFTPPSAASQRRTGAAASPSSVVLTPLSGGGASIHEAAPQGPFTTASPHSQHALSPLSPPGVDGDSNGGASGHFHRSAAAVDEGSPVPHLLGSRIVAETQNMHLWASWVMLTQFIVNVQPCQITSSPLDDAAVLRVVFGSQSIIALAAATASAAAVDMTAGETDDDLVSVAHLIQRRLLGQMLVLPERLKAPQLHWLTWAANQYLAAQWGGTMRAADSVINAQLTYEQHLGKELQRVAVSLLPFEFVPHASSLSPALLATLATAWKPGPAVSTGALVRLATLDIVGAIRGGHVPPGAWVPLLKRALCACGLKACVELVYPYVSATAALLQERGLSTEQASELVTALADCLSNLASHQGQLQTEELLRELRRALSVLADWAHVAVTSISQELKQVAYSNHARILAIPMVPSRPRQPPVSRQPTAPRLSDRSSVRQPRSQPAEFPFGATITAMEGDLSWMAPEVEPFARYAVDPFLVQGTRIPAAAEPSSGLSSGPPPRRTFDTPSRTTGRDDTSELGDMVQRFVNTLRTGSAAALAEIPGEQHPAAPQSGTPFEPIPEGDSESGDSDTGPGSMPPGSRRTESTASIPAEAPLSASRVLEAFVYGLTGPESTLGVEVTALHSIHRQVCQDRDRSSLPLHNFEGSGFVARFEAAAAPVASHADGTIARRHGLRLSGPAQAAGADVDQKEEEAVGAACGPPTTWDSAAWYFNEAARRTTGSPAVADASAPPVSFTGSTACLTDLQGTAIPADMRGSDLKPGALWRPNSASLDGARMTLSPPTRALLQLLLQLQRIRALVSAPAARSPTPSPGGGSGAATPITAEADQEEKREYTVRNASSAALPQVPKLGGVHLESLVGQDAPKVEIVTLVSGALEQLQVSANTIAALHLEKSLSAGSECDKPIPHTGCADLKNAPTGNTVLIRHVDLPELAALHALYSLHTQLELGNGRGEGSKHPLQSWAAQLLVQAASQTLVHIAAAAGKADPPSSNALAARRKRPLATARCLPVPSLAIWEGTPGVNTAHSTLQSTLLKMLKQVALAGDVLTLPSAAAGAGAAADGAIPVWNPTEDAVVHAGVEAATELIIGHLDASRRMRLLRQVQTYCSLLLTAWPLIPPSSPQDGPLEEGRAFAQLPLGALALRVVDDDSQPAGLAAEACLDDSYSVAQVPGQLLSQLLTSDARKRLWQRALHLSRTPAKTAARYAWGTRLRNHHNGQQSMSVARAVGAEHALSPDVPPSALAAEARAAASIRHAQGALAAGVALDTHQAHTLSSVHPGDVPLVQQNLAHLQSVAAAQLSAAFGTSQTPGTMVPTGPSANLPPVRGIPAHEEDSGDDDANSRHDLPAFLLSEVGASGEGPTCTVFLNRWAEEPKEQETDDVVDAATPRTVPADAAFAAASQRTPAPGSVAASVSAQSTPPQARPLRRESSVDTAELDGAASPSTTSSSLAGGAAAGSAFFATPDRTAAGQTRNSTAASSISTRSTPPGHGEHGQEAGSEHASALSIMAERVAFGGVPPMGRVRGGLPGSDGWVAAQGMRLLSRSCMRTTFMQMQQQLHNPTLGTRMVDVVRLRQGRRPWRIDYVGEGGQDVGGLFNEALSAAIDELMDPTALPLFVRSQNAANNAGSHRDCVLPAGHLLRGLEDAALRPAAAPQVAARSFQFLGILMGVALRLQFPLPLRLPPIVWKLLLQRPVSLCDVASADAATARGIASHAAQHGVTAAQVLKLAVQIVPPSTEGGSSGSAALPSSIDCVLAASGEGCPALQVVTGAGKQPATMPEWVLSALRAKVLEVAPPIAAIRDGLGLIIPLQALDVWSSGDFEAELCGQASLDLDLLQRNTRYEGFSPGSDAVKHLWLALGAMSPQEQALVLRFVWARDRLPSSDAAFSQPFVIARFYRDEPDASLPQAHSCSFQLDLPEYSSVAVLRRQLLLAAESCIGYDLDGGARGLADS